MSASATLAHDMEVAFVPTTTTSNVDDEASTTTTAETTTDTGRLDWGNDSGGEADLGTAAPAAPTIDAADTTGQTQETESTEQAAAAPQPYYPVELGPRRFGQVDSFDAQKGWGFLHDFYTGEVFFVHCSEVKPRYTDRLGEGCIENFKNCLHQGEYVEFCVGTKPDDGRPCAKWVTGPGNGTIQMDHAVIYYIMYRDSRTGKHIRPGRGSRSGNRDEGGYRRRGRGRGGGGGRGRGGYYGRRDTEETGRSPRRQYQQPESGW